MKLKKIISIVLLIPVLYCCSASKNLTEEEKNQQMLNGKWKIRTTLGNSEENIDYILNFEKSVISELNFSDSNEGTIKQVKFDGKKLACVADMNLNGQAVELKFDAIVDGNNINGSINSANKNCLFNGAKVK